MNPCYAALTSFHQHGELQTVRLSPDPVRFKGNCPSGGFVLSPLSASTSHRSDGIDDRFTILSLLVKYEKPEESNRERPKETITYSKEA